MIATLSHFAVELRICTTRLSLLSASILTLITITLPYPSIAASGNAVSSNKESGNSVSGKKVSASGAEYLLDEIVVTASKKAQTIRETASSVSVLSAGTLEKVDHTHLNEVMQRIPGTWISRGNGQEHLTAIRSPVLTGAGSCGAFLMSQDGISLRSPGFCNVNELFESVSELANRIEVIKGPGSSVYGGNAMHGVVNIRTPAPETDLHQLKLEAGPDNYYRMKLSASNSEFRVDASGTSDGGYKDDSGYGQEKLLLKHQVQTNERSITTTLAYTNLNQETAGFVQGPEVYKREGIKRDNPNPESYRDARSLRLALNYATTIGQGSNMSEIQFTPYLRSVDMTFLQHFLPGEPVEKNGHDSIGIQALWNSANSRLQIGIDLDYTEAYLEEFQNSPTTGSAFLAATIPVGSHYDYDVDATTAGFFVQYLVQPTDKLNIILGLRLESTGYDYNNRMLAGNTRDNGANCGFGGCRFNRPADRTDHFQNVSPKIGWIYSVNESHQLYGQFSNGFRAPQATELYRLQGAQNIANIDPEEMNAIEFGFRGDSAWLKYDIGLFSMRKQNFIFRDTARLNVDNGKSSHQGIEIDLSGDLSETLSARLAFTWAEHRFDNNPALSASPIKGNIIDTAPRTLGSATLEWQPTVAHQVELEWVHIGSYYEDPENQHQYPGHDLLHLRGNWRASDSLSVFYRIMNLTNEDYAERADFAFGMDRYFVGTPRSVYLGATINF